MSKNILEKRISDYLGFLYNIFILSMIFVVSANNAIMFLIVWELMSVISFFLVVYEHEKPETRKAGFIYIVMTHIGTGFIHNVIPDLCRNMAEVSVLKHSTLQARP